MPHAIWPQGENLVETMYQASDNERKEVGRFESRLFLQLGSYTVVHPFPPISCDIDC